MATRVVVWLGILGGICVFCGCEQGKEVDDAVSRAEAATKLLASTTQMLEKTQQEKADLQAELERKSTELARLQAEYARALKQIDGVKAELQVVSRQQVDAVSKAKVVIQTATTLEKHVQEKVQQIRDLEQLNKDLQAAIMALESQLGVQAKPTLPPATSGERGPDGR